MALSAEQISMPSAAARPICQRLRQRIENIPAFPGRREESSYGPIDKLLNFYFSDERWMIKPQAPIREADPNPPTSRSSFDSYGEPLKAGQPWKFPDFIVCHYTETGMADVPVLAIEVKRDNGERFVADRPAWQMGRYLETLGSRARPDIGIIIWGNQYAHVTQILTHAPEDGEPFIYDVGEFHPLTSRRFLDLLNLLSQTREEESVLH